MRNGGFLMKRQFEILAGVLIVFMAIFLSPGSAIAAEPREQLEGIESAGVGFVLDMMESICASPTDAATKQECDNFYREACRLYRDQFPSKYLYHCGNSLLQIWNQYKVTILIGLAGIAILIGMILYDRSQKRGSTGSYGGQGRFAGPPQRGGRFSFDDDQDDDILGPGGMDRGRAAPRRDFDLDREDFRLDEPRRADDIDRRDEVNHWGDSGEVPLPKRGGGVGVSLHLRGIEGDFAGQSIPLSKDTITIGRSRDCNLVMRNYVKGVSKMHCAVRFSASRKRYQIMDLGSSYGTYLNGEKLGAKTPRDLKRGDTIYLGSKKVGFRVTD